MLARLARTGDIGVDGKPVADDWDVQLTAAPSNYRADAKTRGRHVDKRAGGEGELDDEPTEEECYQMEVEEELEEMEADERSDDEAGATDAQAAGAPKHSRREGTMKRLSKLLGLHVQYKCRLCGGKAVRSPAAMKSHRVGKKSCVRTPQQGRRRFQQQRWGEQQQRRRGQPRADRRPATAAAGAGAAWCRASL